ncbi:MAG: hypothetical protein SGARI_005633 [Bacillariaceae sp.]
MADLSGIDVASMASEEGFEVMELYDEEMGYVKNVLAPPREDSSRQLGVEILQNSDQEMFFEDAFRSVHDFSDAADLSDLDDSDASSDDEKKEDAVKKNTHYNSLPPSMGESKNGIEITDVSERERRFVQRSWRDFSSRSLNASLPSVRFSVGDIQVSDDEGGMLESIQEMDAEDCKAYFDTTEIFGTFETEVKYIDRMLSEDSADVSAIDDAQSKDSQLVASKDSRTSGDRYIDNMLSEDSVNTDLASDTESHDDNGSADTMENERLRIQTALTARAASTATTTDVDATPRQDNRDQLTMSPQRNEAWTSGMQPTGSFGSRGNVQSPDGSEGLDPIKTMSMPSASSKEMSACEENSEFDASAYSSDHDHAAQSYSTASTIEQQQHQTTIQMAESTDGDDDDLGFEVMEN